MYFDTYISRYTRQDLKYKIGDSNVSIVVLDPQLNLWILRIGIFFRLYYSFSELNEVSYHKSFDPSCILSFSFRVGIEP